MGKCGKLRSMMIVPAMILLLACPAWGATSGGKSSHYPGQDCKECHKGHGMSAGKGAVKSAPSNSSGTDSGGTQAAPAKSTEGASR